jgi:hypothetical protein
VADESQGWTSQRALGRHDLRQYAGGLGLTEALSLTCAAATSAESAHLTYDAVSFKFGRRADKVHTMNHDLADDA